MKDLNAIKGLMKGEVAVVMVMVIKMKMELDEGLVIFINKTTLLKTKLEA